MKRGFRILSLIDTKTKIIEKFPHIFEGDANKVEQAEKIMEALRQLIALCGDDPNRDGLLETPQRVLKAFLEYTEGYQEDPKEHLKKVFDVKHRELSSCEGYRILLDL